MLNKRTVVHVEFVERDEVVVDGREQKKKRWTDGDSDSKLPTVGALFVQL